MNPIIKALVSIGDFLAQMGVSYMVFGGIANSIYGNPRQTFDIDIKFALKSGQDTHSFLEALERVGRVIPENPKEFVEETNVIPVNIQGVRVDLVVAELPFEIEAIRRSRSMDFYGAKIKVCTPEDLIIQKAVSIREKDWDDIRYVIENLRDEMDWDYLLKHCRDLSDFLDDPEIYNRVKGWKNGKAV